MKETTQNPGVGKTCSTDRIIREFALGYLERLGLQDERRKKDLDNIRTKVRSLGRLLNKMNKDCVALNSKSLSHFLKPGQFRLVVAYVKALSQEADSPQLAITLGHYVKQACLLKMSLGVV